jgi:toxin ParE1/3/4
MSKLPFFSPQAQTDLHEILEYIALDKPFAGMAFVQHLRDKCTLLAENPELGEVRSELGENVRIFTVEKYIIFYRIRESQVEIIRVLSGYRDWHQMFRAELLTGREME